MLQAEFLLVFYISDLQYVNANHNKMQYIQNFTRLLFTKALMLVKHRVPLQEIFANSCLL